MALIGSLLSILVVSVNPNLLIKMWITISLNRITPNLVPLQAVIMPALCFLKILGKKATKSQVTYLNTNVFSRSIFLFLLKMSFNFVFSELSRWLLAWVSLYSAWYVQLLEHILLSLELQINTEFRCMYFSFLLQIYTLLFFVSIIQKYNFEIVFLQMHGMLLSYCIAWKEESRGMENAWEREREEFVWSN